MTVNTKPYPLTYWDSVEKRLNESITQLQDKVGSLLEPLDAKVDMKDAMLAKAQWRRDTVGKLLTDIRATAFLKYQVALQLHQGKAAAGVHSLGYQCDVLLTLIRNQEILLANLGERESQEEQLNAIQERLATIKGVGDAVANEKARWRDLNVSLDILGEIDLPGGSNQLQKLRTDLSNIELKVQQVAVSHEISMTIPDELWPVLEGLGVALASPVVEEIPS